MAWFGKNDKKSDKNNKDKPVVEGATAKDPKNQATQTPSKTTDDRSQKIAIALANAKAARERIGEDTIQRIAEAIKKKQNSPLEQAKAKIAKITENEADRVAEEILNMLETKH